MGYYSWNNDAVYLKKNRKKNSYYHIEIIIVQLHTYML